LDGDEWASGARSSDGSVGQNGLLRFDAVLFEELIVLLDVQETVMVPGLGSDVVDHPWNHVLADRERAGPGLPGGREAGI